MPLFEIKVFSVLSDKQFSELKQEIQKMGLNFAKIDEGITALQGQMVNIQSDVSQIAAVVEELRANASDPADQAKLDGIGETLTTIAATASAVDAGLDAISGIANEAPAPEPTPEPAPETPTEEVL